MDPNAALRMAREAERLGDYETASALYADLDRWLTSGGYLPDEWDKNR